MSSSSSSPPPQCDVFVSFRGKDVRNNFISYVFNWLEKEGFNYFHDEEPEDAGKKIEDKIFTAVHHARVALIVFSENYADSKWCLNELVKILECSSEPKNLVVIPAFYGVHTADVKNLTSKSKFGQAFQRLCRQEENVQQIEIWREALQEVKRFSGFELKNFGGEADFFDAITHSLYVNVHRVWLLNLLKNVIGVDRLANDVISLLKIGQEEVRMIGISGTEGIGKTMVAKATCKGTLGEFDRLIFLDKVGETKENDFVHLRKKLLQNLNKHMWYDDNSHGQTEKIKSYLCYKKILLVLDGVTKKEQMEELGVEDRHLFNKRSRILITTRDQNLLKDLEVDDEYIVEGLNRDEAFRLFCLHAFRGEEPKESFEELSRYLAHYAGGHPLALRKWGSYLKSLKKKDWQKFSNKLVNKPERINSIIPDFRQIFLEYPCRVVGTRGGDCRTKTWKDEGYKGVRKIEGGVDSGGIKFITVQYDKNGHSQKTVTRGIKGARTHTIELDYPGEYLIYMSGHTKEDSGRTILQSLTFHTNKGKRKSIGTDEGGRKFSYTGHKIVGFHGSCSGSHLESLEAIYKRIAHTPIIYSNEVFGPFGGAGEESWDSNDINGIFVRYDNFISSITFKVDDDTSSKPIYGGYGEEDTFKVKLETPYECITSFSGFFENAYDGRILIKSLTFQTNKRILGPIGREKGKHFSSPSPSKAVKVIRFFGRTVDYLESIGAEVKPHYPFKSVGLYGSSNASNWDDRNDDCSNVRKINVEFAPNKAFIRSVTFHYKMKYKKLRQPKRHPGTLAEVVEPCKIKTDADEYLTSMSGYYMDDGITSLMFETNKRTLEFIGREEGIYFSSPVTGGKIVGFYGMSDENLKAIGAYFEPVSHLYPINSIGPFRGSGGENRDGSSGETWDHRKFKDVRKIEVTHDINIHCIKFVYDDGGDQSYLVTYEGCKEGDYPKVTTVTLDNPREYLTSISGYVQKDAIQSLTFYSNKGRYGPCGEEMGKHFWYPSNGSRVTGFYGTWDPDKKTLKSIGVYVEPIPLMYPFKTVGPFGDSHETNWDDGVHTDVRGFCISVDKAIKAIRIAYDDNGSFLLGSKHGETGNNNYEVLLDYPKERLLSIWVWMDEDGKTGHPIHDLRIFTTKGNYGPFNPDAWQKQNELTRFHIPSQQNGGRIVGFFGRAAGYLHSIGARLEP